MAKPFELFNAVWLAMSEDDRYTPTPDEREEWLTRRDRQRERLGNDDDREQLHKGCGGVLETHCDTDVTAAGTIREYWLKCDKCGEIFAANEPDEEWEQRHQEPPEEGDHL